MSAKKILVFGRAGEKGRFRPSDWIERLAGCCARFDGQRLRWSELIYPAVVENEKCLVIDTELETVNRESWNFVLGFVTSNRLDIREQQVTAESGTGESHPAAA